MLGKAAIAAVIPITDLERAREFYEGVLGLRPSKIDAERREVIYSINGTSMIVYERATASSGEHTIAAFRLADGFDDAVKALLAAGVTFDTFDIPGMDMPWDEYGVLRAEDQAAAWFKDPFGNILAIETSD